MARKPKPYSQRSPGQRARIDRYIRRLGGDRERMLRQLRRGEWHPFARKAESRLPNDLPSNPERYQGSESYTGREVEDLRESALKAMDRFYDALEDNSIGEADEYKKAPEDAAREFNRDAVIERIGEMNREQLQWTANASPEKIRAAARLPYVRNPWYYHSM